MNQVEETLRQEVAKLLEDGTIDVFVGHEAASLLGQALSSQGLASLRPTSGQEAHEVGHVAVNRSANAAAVAY